MTIEEIALGAIDDRIKELEQRLEALHKKHPEGLPAHGFFIRIEELKKLRSVVLDRISSDSLT